MLSLTSLRVPRTIESLEAVDVAAAPDFDDANESCAAAPALEPCLEQPVASERPIRMQADSVTEPMVTSGGVGGSPLLDSRYANAPRRHAEKRKVDEHDIVRAAGSQTG